MFPPPRSPTPPERTLVFKRIVSRRKGVPPPISLSARVRVSFFSLLPFWLAFLRGDLVTPLSPLPVATTLPSVLAFHI